MQPSKHIWIHFQCSYSITHDFNRNLKSEDDLHLRNPSLVVLTFENWSICRKLYLYCVVVFHYRFIESQSGSLIPICWNNWDFQEERRKGERIRERNYIVIKENFIMKLLSVYIIACLYIDNHYNILTKCNIRLCRIHTYNIRRLYDIFDIVEYN